MPKEEGGRMSGAGVSRELRLAGGRKSGVEDLASGRRQTKRTSKQVRTEAGQHCCCPSSSLALRYVTYDKSLVIKYYPNIF